MRRIVGKDKKGRKILINVPSYDQIVVNNQTKEVAGWRFPHITPYPNLGTDLSKFRVSVNDIQKAAGVKFSFPSGATEIAPSKEWTVDFGALTKAKRAKCGANASDD